MAGPDRHPAVRLCLPPARRALLAAEPRVGRGGLAAGAVLVGSGFGWYAYTEIHSVLPPAAYAGLRLGTPAGEAARVLPDRHVQDPPSDRAPAPPEGADCRYYRASGELFVSVDHFRLCFGPDGRLVAKDVVPRIGLSRRSHEDHDDHENHEEHEEFAR
ncbi:hypothetical protein ACPF8X_34915 [Streptomyces sp. G35A]